MRLSSTVVKVPAIDYVNARDFLELAGISWEDKAIVANFLRHPETLSHNFWILTLNS
jgi:hypothetical protein